jgi:ketosteroid isomerase-like protein
VDERSKLEVFAREIEAWNSGDLELVTAGLTECHEWDLTRSGIPAEKEVHWGRAAYLAFARRWRDALGATQLKIVEAKELPDGRLFTRLLHTGTGARSGVSVERTTVQILSFKDGKVARTVVYGDLNEGRAAGGL